MENEISLEERLTAEMGWLQKLARSLIRDPGTADDVVQDVLLGSLRSGQPGRGKALRAELFSRLKTRAFNKRREAARRRTREEGYAAEHALEPSSDDVARMVSDADTAQQLLGEVMALPETHQAILLLCYFEGRPQREIAATLGTTDEAVRTRLTRARTALRRRLDESSDRGRAGWLPAVCALAERAPVTQTSLWLPTWTFVLGFSGMKLVAGAAVAVLMGILALALRTPASGVVSDSELSAELGSAIPESASESRAADEDLGALNAVDAQGSATRQPAVERPKPQAERLLAGMLPYGQEITIVGRVVEELEDGEKAPLEGATVRVRSYLALEGLAREPDYPLVSAQTDRLGVFEVTMPSFSDGVLEVTCSGKARTFKKIEGFWPGHGAVPASLLRSQMDEDIVLKEGAELNGRVTDSAGTPIAGVSVQAFWPGGFAVDNVEQSPWGHYMPPLAVTDADGGFAIRHEVGPAGELIFLHPSYQTKTITPALDGAATTVQLREAASISGTVDRTAWAAPRPGSAAPGDDAAARPVVVVAMPFGDTLDPSSNGIATYAQPDVDGRYSIGGLVPGESYHLQVLSGALPTRMSEPCSHQLTAVAGTSDADLAVCKGYQVSFRVVGVDGAALDAETMNDLGVHPYLGKGSVDDLDYRYEGLFRSPLFTDSWEDGQVQLERLVPDSPDDRLFLQIWGRMGQPPVFEYGPFQDGEAVDLGDIVLTPEPPAAPKPSVEVVALDGEGQPASGVTVEHFLHPKLVDLDDPSALWLTTREHQVSRSQHGAETDSEGKATLDGLNPGIHFFRIAAPTGWHAETLRTVGADVDPVEFGPWGVMASSAEATSTDRVTLEVPPLCQVRGRVSLAGSDLTHDELAGAAISFGALQDSWSIRNARSGARHAARGGKMPDAAWLGPNGEFAMDQVPAGDWLAVVALPGEKQTLERVVSTRAPAVHLDLILERSTARGVVMDSNGAPVGGALIRHWDGGHDLASAISSSPDEMLDRGISSFRHSILRSSGGVITAADGSYSLPVPGARSDWYLVVEHEDYATGVVRGPSHMTGGEIVMPRCELMPCGELQVLAAGRTDIWWISLELAAESSAAAPDEWADSMSGGREGFTFQRVPVGKVSVRAFMEVDLGIDLGATQIEEGQRTVIEIDPVAAPSELKSD